jgi:hypothetical protein
MWPAWRAVRLPIVTALRDVSGGTMTERPPLSVAGKLIVVGSVVAAAGVVIQIASGAAYPQVPPVFFILLIPAGLVAFGRWRWTPAIAALGGLFLTTGLFLSGSSARLFDLSRLGVSIGLWVQALAVFVTTVAGIIATAKNHVKGRRSLKVRPE